MERRTGDKIQIAGSYQYNAFYNGYAIQQFWHQAKIYTAIDAINFNIDLPVLDVGCGSGVLSSLVANKTTNQVIGIDGNKQAIEFATKQYHNNNLSFKQGLIDELNFTKESIGNIIFLEVMEHISSEQAKNTLKQFHELLAKDGRVIISTPNRHSTWVIIEWLMDKLHLAPNMGEGQHEHLYSIKELQKLAVNNGFVVDKIYTINTFAPWLAIISKKLANKIHQFELKLALNWGSLIVLVLKKQ